MTKYTRCIFSVVVLASGFLSFGCVGSIYIEYREMDLSTNARSQQILNLRNYGDDNVDFYRQSERLVKNGFLGTRSEEYGYYRVDYNTSRSEIWGALVEEFTLTALFCIFDSSGNLVKRYEKSGKFSQYTGHGTNNRTVTGRAAKVYSRLYEDLFQTANMQSTEINRALRDTGPITDSNSPQALQNIASYFRGGSSSYAKPLPKAARQQREISEEERRQWEENRRRQAEQQLLWQEPPSPQEVEQQRQRWQEEEQQRWQEEEQQRRRLEEQRRRLEEQLRRLEKNRPRL